MKLFELNIFVIFFHGNHKAHSTYMAINNF